jgi:signal transduction histidine kinase
VHALGNQRLFHASSGIVDGDSGNVRWYEARFANRGPHSPLGAARGGGVLVWSDTGGVERVTERGTTTLVNAETLKARVTRALYEDSLGRLWAGWIPSGSRPGFGRMKDGVFTPVSTEPAGQSANVSTIADDGHGHLWVNNTARKVIYKLAGDSVIARVDSSAGVSAVVTAIVPQGLDTLWMLTNRASLLRLTGRTVTRVRFVGDDVLLAPTWNSLARDSTSLWIATSAGIARLDFAALHASADGRKPAPVPRTYDASDGLLNGHTPFTVVNAVAAGKGGRMWFATSAGLALYDPRFDRDSRGTPVVHIEEVVASGKRLPSASPVIPPQPDRVDIHFTAVSVRAPERVRLQYMLEGADHEWVTAGPERVATYTQLRAGHYRFRVRALGDTSGVTSAESELALRVVPMWYEAGWFRVLAILAALVGGPVVVYQLLHQRARRREAQLRLRFDAALEERNRIARELHDTLLQGFSGITLQLHMVAHTLTTAPAKAAERLDRVLGLADNTLVEARQMIWDLRAPELEYQDLSDALASAARSAIVDAPIELKFSVRGDERRLPPLVESTALRVGREAATNAARHARATRIEIELAYGDRRLDLHVRDDGSGFPIDTVNDQRLNGHWGIAGMRERAARAGGAVDISSTNGGGTTVSLQLPIA